MTIQRARLVEVEYFLRVSLGVSSLTGTSEAVHVVLPIRIVNFISLDPPSSEPLIVTTSNSVISLDTPRADLRDSQSFIMEGSHTRSMINEQPMVASASEKRKPSKSNREDISSSRSGEASEQKYRRPHRHHEKPLPVPTLATANTLHDLGSVESAEHLHGLLGEIPGSVSILEESDISVSLCDSGYNEEGTSDSDTSYTMGEDEFSEEQGYSYDSYERSGSEDVESDEELERMVGCASAQMVSDAAFFDPQPAARPPAQRQMIDGLIFGPASVRDPVEEHLSHILASTSRSAPKACAAPRLRILESSRQSTQECRSGTRPAGRAAMDPVDDHGPPICATRSMVKISEAESGNDESRSSVYSTSTRSQATKKPQASIACSSEASLKRPSPMYGPRPATQRASTAPGAAALKRDEPEKLASALDPLPSKAANLASGHGNAEAAGANSVRARIAMLEQKSREVEWQDEGPVVGGRPRSMSSV